MDCCIVKLIGMILWIVGIVMCGMTFDTPLLKKHENTDQPSPPRKMRTDPNGHVYLDAFDDDERLPPGVPRIPTKITR